MTNQEAIEDIEKNILPVVGGKSLLMAISALESQEAKHSIESSLTQKALDTISRQAAIALANSLKDDLPDDERMVDAVMAHNEGIMEYQTKLSLLPSAHPEIEERKEESAQNVPKEDLISRKAAIDAECEVCQIAPKKEMGHNCTYYVHGCKEIECLRELPSAQPERKKGKWTKDCACEICGFKPWYERDIHTLSFCPNCGADLRGDDHDKSK